MLFYKFMVKLNLQLIFISFFQYLQEKNKNEKKTFEDIIFQKIKKYFINKNNEIDYKFDDQFI